MPTSGEPTPSADDGEIPGHGYPRPDVPRLSLAERDRRWERIRQLMERDDLDALVALHVSGGSSVSANSRYLTSIAGSSAVVFPREGEVTAITGAVPTPDYWLKFQDWVDDVRPSFFDGTRAVIERLREHRLERGRIGITDLAGGARTPNGLVTAGDLEALRDALPHADLVNATHLMDEARFVKGAEEIAMLERSVALVEDVFAVLDREARAGVPECVVYARMMATLLEQGSEPHSLMLLTAGRPLPAAVSTLPSRRRLEPEDVIAVEVDGKWCGYLGHGATTTWVGEPDETELAMAELQLEATRHCWDALRPGRVLGDFVGICAEVTSGTPFSCVPVMHGRGLGMDAPVLVFQPRSERTRDWVLEENSVFVIKPQVSNHDGTKRVMWGDSVVTTPAGARRLGRRPAPIAAYGGAESAPAPPRRSA